MKTKTANKKATKAPTKRALDVLDFKSETDPLGSYTGTPNKKKEVPTQDADDL